MKRKTPKRLHPFRWDTCRRCRLHAIRRRVVYGAGEVPCALLMVGLGPGKSEDLRGLPFIGPAGKLLRRGIESATAMAKLVEAPSIYLTNVVACRPSDTKQGENRDPTDEEAWACMPRIVEIAKKVKPREVILLGLVAQKHCHSIFPAATNLMHPAAMVRSGGTESPGYLMFVRGMSEVFRRLSLTRARRHPRRL